MADGRWQMAEGTFSRRFKPLVNEDHQASLDGGIKQGNKGQGGLNPLPLCEAVSFRAASCPYAKRYPLGLPSGAKRHRNDYLIFPNSLSLSAD